MRIDIGMPCHHPAWPRKCPVCQKQAHGFNITMPIGEKWAYGWSGLACIDCYRVVVCDNFEGIPIKGFKVGKKDIENALWRTCYFYKAEWRIHWLSVADFERMCEG